MELQKTANFYHIPWSLKVTENSNLLSSTLYYLLVMKEFDSSDSVCQILLYAQMLSCGLCGAKLRPSKSALTIVSQTEPIFHLPITDLFLTELRHKIKNNPNGSVFLKKLRCLK